jgi:hypothetical protein
MEVDSSTTRGERRGIGPLLVKKEFKEDDVEPFPIKFCVPLQVEDFMVGLI